MDANKDGTVSLEEEQAYLQKHPESSDTNSTKKKIDSNRGVIDALA